MYPTSTNQLKDSFGGLSRNVLLQPAKGFVPTTKIFQNQKKFFWKNSPEFCQKTKAIPLNKKSPLGLVPNKSKLVKKIYAKNLKNFFKKNLFWVQKTWLFGGNSREKMFRSHKKSIVPFQPTKGFPLQKNLKF
jgi:hypothetical protein